MREAGTHVSPRGCSWALWQTGEWNGEKETERMATRIQTIILMAGRGDRPSMASIASFHVVMYVSSHGLGHVTRCVQVADALMATRGTATEVTFVTTAANCEILGAERVRHDTHVCREGGAGGCAGGCAGGSVGGCASGVSHVLRLPGNAQRVVRIRDRELDAGAKQRDAYCIDVDATRDAVERLHLELPRLEEEEAAWLGAVRPDVVVSDVVGVALPAARRANVPTVLMTNFTWEFIYRPFVRGERDAFREAVAREEAMLAHADVFLRLPGYSPVRPASLASLAIDVPMIVRPQRVMKGEMRARYGIQAGTKVCLLMVGGHSLDIEGFASRLVSGRGEMEFGEGAWVCFVTESVLAGQGKGGALPEHIRLVPSSAYIPDYVGMSDVVLGKVGYGTVSECISSGTPLVYVARENFAEEADMAGLLKAHRAGVEMSREVFLSGKWSESVAKALELEVIPGDTRGAQVVAELIRDTADVCGNQAFSSVSMPRPPLPGSTNIGSSVILVGSFGSESG